MKCHFEIIYKGFFSIKTRKGKIVYFKNHKI